MGGPDGGGCSGKRKKREDARVLDTRPLQEDIINRNRSLLSMEKRQTIYIVGYQKESTQGVEYRGRADETVDRIGRTTEGALLAAGVQVKRSKRQAGGAKVI